MLIWACGPDCILPLIHTDWQLHVFYLGLQGYKLTNLIIYVLYNVLPNPPALKTGF